MQFPIAQDLEEVLVSQGAEARVYKTQFLSKETIVKERFAKKYRHPVLDEKITKTRLGQEAKNAQKCRQWGIDTPAIYHVDTVKNRIFMEYVHGYTVKAHLKNDETQEKDALDLSKRIGSIIATLHDNNLVHGDLTTSNIMLRNRDPQHIVMIDFGLSYISTLVEDKAVDLYVMERAFLSTHPNSEQLFESLLEGYKAQSKNAKAIIDKLNQVRLRGRKRSMIG